MTPRILIAPDSFKGSAAADAVSRAIAEGWNTVRPADEVRRLPLADGGEGTVDAFLAGAPSSEPRTATVEGPDGSAVRARWAFLPEAEGGTAVVEVAETSGLGLLDPLIPLEAHTRGLGQLIAAAVRAGSTRVVVGLGGSATSDGGSGALAALGARFLDADGRPVPPGNVGLGVIARVVLDGLPPAPPRGVTLMTDVRSPLLGPRGAARIFGPQKGATPAQVNTLEANLARFVDQVAAVRPGAVGLAQREGAGAAGGTGFGLLLWGAEIRPGADEIGRLLGLPQAVRAADLVITGEGRFDEQTHEGKVVSHVAALARAAGKPASLVAGVLGIAPDGFADVAELSALAHSAQASRADAVRWARQAGELLASRWG
ncbi:glycerate kinase [Leifsonia xyli]|uniref:glycerate kinase n=1 Tax=Leifsonia xyli TaxID=1575 RepID=UPI0007CDD7E3|nr:glycerate kinase [Leifsonia xyli]